MNRTDSIQRLKESVFDVAIIGSGINGATSAAALAAKGYKVALIDKGDFAGETSMHSSNLVWGGIKYLENHEFTLVYHLCKGRNELLKAYPSQVKEIRFLTNIEKGFRHPRWFLYVGTWLYWLMGFGFTKIPKLISKKQLDQYEPVMSLENSVGAFEYSDAYLYDNDSRFVLNFVKNAHQYGAVVCNYMSCEQANYHHDSDEASRQTGGADDTESRLWSLSLKDQQSGECIDVKAHCLVNATGPYLDELNKQNGVETQYQHLLSQGIHILVPRLTEVERVLTFFADDGRLFFAIPMGDKTCIGTTDHRVDSPTPDLKDDDIQFVLDNINKRLNLSYQISAKDIISTRNGVRPLAVKKPTQTSSNKPNRKDEKNGDDFLNLSRKHVLDVDHSCCHISIFGGKLTDCVNVGKEVVDEINQFIPNISEQRKEVIAQWFGEPSAQKKSEFLQRGANLVKQQLLNENALERLWRRYGMDANNMIGEIVKDHQLSKPLLKDCQFLKVEFNHIKHSEMVVTLEDFIRRRSKLGLIRYHDNLSDDEGLMKICEALFGDDAKSKYDEYVHNKPVYSYEKRALITS